jgi:UDP-3-O-acyl-N-acetylglucosamine deacetylase
LLRRDGFNFAVLQQQTLNRPVSFAGIGLHSGNRVNMTFLPAPVNSGVRFRRVDLDGKPEIEARVEHVVETARCTTLGKGEPAHPHRRARLGDVCRLWH